MWNHKRPNQHRGTATPNELQRVELELELARADAAYRRDVVQMVTARARKAAHAVRDQMKQNHFGETIQNALEGERGRG